MTLRLMRLCLPIAAMVLLAPAALIAQSGAFDLQVNGKTIGRDVYTLSPGKGGFKLASRFSYKQGGQDFDASNEFKLAADYTYVEGGSSSVATQSHTSYTPDKTRTILTIGFLQAGAQDSRQLSIKPSFILMPNYDAGAAQGVLLEAILHPAKDNLYNVVVPGSRSAGRPAGGDTDAGNGGAGGGGQGNFAYDALWQKAADTTGTLDGKQVPIHTYTLTSGKYVWTFYADDANLLMQMDNPVVHASYVRAKFKLDAPK